MNRALYFVLLLSCLISFSCQQTKEQNFADYKIISSGCEPGNCPVFKNPREAMKELEQKLQPLLQSGYKPVGGISVVQSNEEKYVGVVIYQAVAK